MGFAFRSKFALAFCAYFYTTSVNAESELELELPPKLSQIDENGVDLTSGNLSVPDREVSIGEGENRLAYQRILTRTGWVNSFSGVLNSDLGPWPEMDTSQIWESGSSYTVSILGKSESFYNMGTGFYCCETATFAVGTDAGTLEDIGDYYRYTQSNGTVAIFSKEYSDSPPAHGDVRSNAIYGALSANRGRVISITRPDGYKLDFIYKQKIIPNIVYASRIQSITDNQGSQLKFSYQIDDFNQSQGFPQNGTSLVQWFRVVGVNAINNSIEYCLSSADSCQLSQGWPYISYNPMTSSENTETTVDVMGDKIKYSYSNSTYTMGYNPDSIFFGSEVTPRRIYAFHAPVPALDVGSTWDPVKSIVTPSGTWNYSYSAVSDGACPGGQCLEVTRTNPSGDVVRVRSLRGYTASFNYEFSGAIRRVTDELGRATVYEHSQGPGQSGIKWNLTNVTYPDGNGKFFTYNGRNVVTASNQVPKSGSDISSNITAYATYPASCVNIKLCDRPLAVTGPNGQTTNYTYDSTHGGVLTETLPADANGVRLQKRYSYTQLSAKVKDASGTLVAQSPMWMLTRVSECTSATAANPASCVGTAAEKVTTYAYNHNNLWRTSETTAAGDGSSSATVTYTYDYVGNVTSVNGPRTDIDDTSYTTYDAIRRKVYEIGADPDGSGPLPRQMIRHVYDAYMNEIRTEYGTGSVTSGSDFSIVKFDRMTYDANNRVIRKEVVTP